MATSDQGFSDAATQIEQFRTWNSQYRLGFTDDQTASIATSWPEPSGDQPLVCLTLCWTLATLGATVAAKIKILQDRYPLPAGAPDHRNPVKMTREFKTDKRHLMLAKGAPEFVPRQLWWQILDMGANVKVEPETVPAATAAGTEVFDAACQHPEYFVSRSQNGFPEPMATGLRMKYDSEPNTLGIPFIRGFDGKDLWLIIDLHLSWRAYSQASSPVRIS